MQQLLRFSLENYKAFSKRADITIRPLTLFFGYNSAGKSAALRFLNLLADSTNGRSSAPLNLRSEALKGIDFGSLISKHSSSLRLNVWLGFETMSIEVSILDLPDLGKQIIEEFNIHQHKNKTRSVFKWSPENQSPKDATQIYNFSSAQQALEVPLTFDGLVPVGYPENLRRYFEPIATSLESIGKRFVSLSADCVLPERYEIEVAPTKNVSRRGEGLMSILQAAPNEVIRDMSSWYKAATGYSFQRNRITIGDRTGHRFTLHPNADDKIDIDIVDTGEGMGQVLPVVGLLTLAKHGILGEKPIVSLEHPELHIHPDAHVHLANLLCDVVKSEASPRVLVETHSENLLLGVQLAIAERRMRPSDVAVHWVRGSDEGAIVELVEFDETARPVKDNWPIDVYRTNSKLARDLFEKRRTLKN